MPSPLSRLIASCAFACLAAGAHAKASADSLPDMPASTVASATASVTAASSVPAQALDAQLDCSADGHDFIEPLMASGAIHTQPMHVESNSVSAFRTQRPLTAWGFPVFVALGWQADDPLFVHGDGKPDGKWVYGVVVRGGLDEVRAHAREAGSRALVVRAMPFLVAVVCDAPR